MQSKPSFKKALITGTSSGIGKALATFLDKKKIELIVTSRSDPHLPLDLSDKQQRSRLLEVITEQKPDLIINNAGFGYYGPSLNLTIEEQLNMIDLNVKALMEISIHGAKTLLENRLKGTILNISSAAAFFPFPTLAVYCATKAFVNQFSLALDAELEEQGVRVLSACPGQVQTNFRVRASKGHPQKKDRRTMSVETAVKHLWWQIENQKRLYIFDWKMRAMVFLSKLVPLRTLQKALKKSLSRRYS